MPVEGLPEVTGMFDRAISHAERQVPVACNETARAIVARARGNLRAAIKHPTGTSEAALTMEANPAKREAWVYMAQMRDPRGRWSTTTFKGGGFHRRFEQLGEWRAVNFPLWLEYGTVKTPAFHFLGPAVDAEAAPHTERVRRALGLD